LLQQTLVVGDVDTQKPEKHSISFTHGICAVTVANNSSVVKITTASGNGDLQCAITNHDHSKKNEN
jgi:hypothetical protein